EIGEGIGEFLRQFERRVLRGKRRGCNHRENGRRKQYFHPRRRRLAHFISARFRQKFSMLLETPKSTVKCVESVITISPARCSFGGSQSRQLNSLLPASVNGCGRSRSIGCRASTCTSLPASLVSA